MVGVFSIFGALQAMIFKQFGVGLAAAILIDATLIRAVLLPASMSLLDRWNWYLPGWLEWLPHLEHGHYEPGRNKPTSTRVAPRPLGLRASGARRREDRDSGPCTTNDESCPSSRPALLAANHSPERNTNMSNHHGSPAGEAGHALAAPDSHPATAPRRTTTRARRLHHPPSWPDHNVQALTDASTWFMAFHMIQLP